MKKWIMVFLLAAGVASSTVFAAPAIIASVFAGFAGVLVMADTATASLSSQNGGLHPAGPVNGAPAPLLNVFELDGGAGVVVFRQVDGKLVSRLYRARV